MLKPLIRAARLGPDSRPQREFGAPAASHVDAARVRMGQSLVTLQPRMMMQLESRWDRGPAASHDDASSR
ncbi:hypothetical protein NDU88_007811 [Pleurodeles waltl]|uniref:Uncharacterized protein n=1 Tax=Pleurodeles waltl TaxID=8319 RepID=A0AAV7STJ9_PLEWA|nr:hypothetical protein NDU88_007811 [Pleurodeles waltl]